MRRPIWATVAVLLAACVEVAAGQTDTTIRKAPATRTLSPAALQAVTRYAADPTTAPAQTPRILIRRPVWVKDSLLVSRWAQRDAAPQATTPRLAYRPVRPLTVVALTPAADTSLRMQASPDWRLRAREIVRISRQPPLQVHPSVAAALITQLDSVGVMRMNGIALLPTTATDADREDYGEYVTALNRTVLRLVTPHPHDTQAVRAIALAGLQTSQDAQRFVAAQGATSLPILDTAFALSGDVSGAVVTTWAHMLAASPSTLSAEDSVFVYGRILHARWSHPVPFLYATRIAQLFELRPIVDSLTRDPSSATAGAAKLAERDLSERATAARRADWLTRLRLYIGYVCAGTLDARRQACTDMVAAGQEASRAGSVPTGQPRMAAALRRVAAATDQMVQARGLTIFDQRMVQSLLRRIETSPL